MGTRTYSRRGVLTAAGRRRAGLEARDSILTYDQMSPEEQAVVREDMAAIAAREANREPDDINAELERNFAEEEKRIAESIKMRYNGWSPDWQRGATPSEFIKARNLTTRPGFLSPLVPEDISNHKLFLSADGTVGVAVSPEGDIQNVFNNGGPKGAGTEALLTAMRNGGKTLDCYDGHLPEFYTQFGFVETGRMKFNPEYAPEGWDFERYDNPDVVFMGLKKTGETDDQIRDRAADKAKWKTRKITRKLYEGDEWDSAKDDSRRKSRV